MRNILNRLLTVLWGELNTEKERYIDGITLVRTELPFVRHGKYNIYADIDYSDKIVSAWQCREHLSRLYSALVSRGRDALDDEPFMSGFIDALDWWLDNDFTNPNWWFNQIGTPASLAMICLMIRDRLDGKRMERAREIISRGSFSHNAQILKWTGANLIWGVRDTVYYALLTDDCELLKRASERIADEIYISDGLSEGIKDDMSFFQHGPQLYSGGYGRSYSLEVAQLIYVFSGSAYSISNEKTDLFERFILEGQRYMTRGARFDYLTVGREVSRRSALSAVSMADTLAYMLKTDGCKHCDELQKYRDALITGNDNFSGTKYFPRSYFISHNTPNFRMSVKGSHSDFAGTEWGNGENRLGWNLSCGSNTSYMSDGDEYYDIAAVWDYASLPGTTSGDITDAELLERAGNGWAGRRGANRDCGGYSENGRGLLHMRLEHDGITGYLAFIAFEGGLICLGSNITANYDTHTTIDQCLYRGDTALPFEKIIGKSESFVNGAFKYVNLGCDGVMSCRAADVTGSWRRNNLGESDAAVTKSTLTVQIQHKAGIRSDYAYAVIAKDAELNTIDSIINTPDCQGVRFTDGSEISTLK